MLKTDKQGEEEIEIVAEFAKQKGSFQGRIQDFKLGGGGGGGALEFIAPNGGKRENCWGISCEKSRFYAKKSFFFSNFRGDAGSATGFDSQKLFVLLYFWLLCCLCCLL